MLLFNELVLFGAAAACVFFSFFFNGGMCLCMCVCVCLCVGGGAGGRGGGKGGSILMARSTSPKMKFSIKDFFSKCNQIRSFLKKSLMEIHNGKLHFLSSC